MTLERKETEKQVFKIIERTSSDGLEFKIIDGK